MRSVLTIAAILALAVALFFVLRPANSPTQPVIAITAPADDESPAAPSARQVPADSAFADAIETVDLALDDEDDWEAEADAAANQPKPVTNWEEVRTIEGTILSGILKQGEAKRANRDSPIGDDYDFPTMLDVNGAQMMSIPDDPIPSRPSRRQLQEGNGAYLLDGDTVNLTYDLFSWSTGELVESSAEVLPQGLDYTLGADSQNAVGIPDYLSQSIRGRRNGAQLQVVLEQGTAGLPEYLNPDDGYVFVVNIEQGDRRNAHAPEIDLDALPPSADNPGDGGR